MESRDAFRPDRAQLSAFVSSLLARGEVRLGTLFDWRRRGAYGELVADESEGYTRLGGNIVCYDKRFVGAVRVESSTVDESTEENRRVLGRVGGTD